MLTSEKAEETSVGARLWADLLDRHRARWVASLSGESSVILEQADRS
jgi:hypothetical protein